MDAPGDTGPSRRSVTVLVVDRSKRERQRVRRILQQRNDLRIAEAATGQAAIEGIEADAPVVVLTGLQLPDMDAIRLVEQIRHHHGDIPVVLLTAPGHERIAMKALQAGASNYVPREDLKRDLLESLNRVLSVAIFDRRRQRLMACLEERRSCFRLQNEPELLSPLIHLLLEELDVTGFCDETTRTRIGIALTEILTNALYHGNLEVSSDLRQDDERIFFEEARRRQAQAPYKDRLIYVRATVNREAATYEIEDEGPGFDVSIVDHPCDHEAIMRIGGRGLLLVRTFMDRVIHRPPGNHVTLIKYRDPIEADPSA